MPCKGNTINYVLPCLDSSKDLLLGQALHEEKAVVNKASVNHHICIASKGRIQLVCQIDLSKANSNVCAHSDSIFLFVDFIPIAEEVVSTDEIGDPSEQRVYAVEHLMQKSQTDICIEAVDV